MKVSSQNEMLWDGDFHIEKILHLPSILVQSHNRMRNVPDEFEDVLDSIMGKHRHSSLDVLWKFFEPLEVDEEDEDEYDSEDNLIDLQNMHGYWDEIEQCQLLVLFHTAKRSYHSKGSWSSGGIYYTTWIAAPNVNKALQLGRKWAKEMNKKDFANMKKD